MKQTFRQWNEAGYNIIKGSKAVGFEGGEPLFDEKQVTEKYQSGLHGQTDYPEEAYLITDYELCAGEWGD